MTIQELVLNLVILLSYCAVNAAVLTGIWHTLKVGISASHTFKDVFIKTSLSLAIVWLLAMLISRMFCWTAYIADCLGCVCPIVLDHSPGQASAGGVLFFFISATFVQLTLIPVPIRLSRLLFVLTVIASNVIAILLKLGLNAVLV